MPEISRFFGIVISMNYDDHNPPHFHVRYGGARATVEIAGIGQSQVDFHPARWAWWLNGLANISANCWPIGS